MLRKENGASSHSLSKGHASKKSMNNDSILNDLQVLFKENKGVAIERGDDYITFSQPFTDNVHLSPQLFEKKCMMFSHTVTLYDDGSYKTVDRIDRASAGPLSFAKSYDKGSLNARGFFYGAGIDRITGKTGLIRQEWSTEDIKAPVREYMSGTGLRQRPSVWWTGKRIALFFAAVWGLAFLLTGIAFLVLK